MSHQIFSFDYKQKQNLGLAKMSYIAFQRALNTVQDTDLHSMSTGLGHNESVIVHNLHVPPETGRCTEMEQLT